MRMRPILVSAVCSAGAAAALVITEVATLGGTPHIGGDANSSAPGVHKPTQSSGNESATTGSYGTDQIASGGDAQTEDQSTAQAPSNGGGDQSSLAGSVQQALSNVAPPITVGPIGH
jgi:hypothetical protein